MRALVIQHDHVSPSGPVGERLADHGYEVVEHLVVPEDCYHTPGVEPSLPDLNAFDALVAMGAPWSAYDHELIGSWLLPELEALTVADREGIPVLGICFGGQMLATAHGGAVAGSDAPELGWVTVEGDDEIVPSGNWFQWHYDRWTLPPGARELARNASASQAFSLRRNLAVQFHPELTAAMLAGWIANGGAPSLERAGIDADQLVELTRRRDPESRLRAHALVDAWLERIARV